MFWWGRACPYHGGNVSNGANFGVFYVNVNNTVSNVNWNIEAGLYFYQIFLNPTFAPFRLEKINSMQVSVSKRYAQHG